MVGCVGLAEGLSDELEDAPALFLAGLDDGQHRFDEAVAAFALGAETQLAPDHSVTQAAFAGVVGRLDYRITQERPQVLFVMIEFLASRARRFRNRAAASLPRFCGPVEDCGAESRARSSRRGTWHIR